MTRPLQLFIHSAVKDVPYLERLKIHLTLLTRSGQVLIQQHIYRPGENGIDAWLQEMMRTADTQMFLVSADFLPALQSCWPMIRPNLGREQLLMPVYCGYCSLDDTPFKNYMSCNQPETALDGLSEAGQDQVWAQVATAVRMQIQRLDPASPSAPIWTGAAGLHPDLSWPQVPAGTLSPEVEADLALTASAREELVNALKLAFPSFQDMRMLTEFSLNTNIEEITGERRLEVVALDLVKHAERNNCLQDFILKAQRRCPANPELRKFVSSHIHLREANKKFTRKYR